MGAVQTPPRTNNALIDSDDAMPSAVRTLTREQKEWKVSEVNTSAVPGASGAHCLIFDSDTVVRRCWAYPEAWSELGDDALWALLDSTTARVTSAAWQQMVETSRAIASETSALWDKTRILGERHDELLRSCQASRDTMLAAIGNYAESLKRSGVAPETAIVLIKDALRDGLGGEAKCEEPEGASRLREGVAWGIKAYYAA